MTIKTQGGKVITKDGKVSCECCGECCIYEAASFYNDQLTYDDLPDELLYEDIWDTVIIPKVPIFEYLGSFSGVYSLDFASTHPGISPGGNAIIVIFKYDSPDNINQEWGFYHLVYETMFDYYCFGNGVLAGNGLTREDRFVELSDNFASSFSVSGPRSGIVTREKKWDNTKAEYIQELEEWDLNPIANQIPSNPKTICSWLGGGLTLRWNTTQAKWQVNGNNKSGNQNTPVGSYDGGYSVS